MKYPRTLASRLVFLNLLNLSMNFTKSDSGIFSLFLHSMKMYSSGVNQVPFL